MNSNEFMNNFMDKLNNDEFVKDVCPNTGDEFIPTEKNIKEELESYSALLKSGIIEKACKVKILK